MIDPRLVRQAVDLLEKHPDAELDITDMPAGTDKAIHEEIGARAANKKLEASANSEPDEIDSGIADKAARKHESASRMPDALATMNPKSPGLVGSALYGAQDGLTLGHGDEIQGLLQSLAGSEDYKTNRDSMREASANARDQHPNAYYPANAAASMALPVKGPGAAVGVPIGAIAGEGYSDKSISDPSLRDDSMNAGAVGGVLGAVGQRVGNGVSALASKMGDATDNILASALGLTSDELTTLKSSGKFNDLLDVVRSNAKFPYGAQSARESIELPAMASGQPGSLGNAMPQPDEAVQLAAEPGPGNFKQKGLDSAYEQAYMKPSVPATASTPSSPPMDPMSRMASQKLGAMATANGMSGILPTGGLSPSTFQGGIRSAAMSRSGMALGVGGKQMAQAIADYAATSGASWPAAAQSEISRMVKQVMDSPDPDFTDYLAKETSPWYNSASLEVGKKDRSDAPAEPISATKGYSQAGYGAPNVHK